MMGLALHPNFTQNRLLYVAYASSKDGGRVRVVRIPEGGGVPAKVIIEGIPAARFHAGTRLRFGPDGALYFSTSNRDGRGDPSPDDDRILRIVPAK